MYIAVLCFIVRTTASRKTTVFSGLINRVAETCNKLGNGIDVNLKQNRFAEGCYTIFSSGFGQTHY